MLQTDLLSIQISNSDPEVKAKADYDSLVRNLSLIDFSACEHHLKDINLIDKNDSLTFSKIDWDADLKTNSLNNTNSTDLNSVSYSLYTMNGLKLNISLCSDTLTNVQMHLGDLKLNPNETYNFDVNSSYYNDICTPMYKNESSIGTINDKRENVDSNNFTCGGDCTYVNINVSTEYITCSCNSSMSNVEVAPEFGKVILKVINNTNIMVLECYQQFLSFVI